MIRTLLLTVPFLYNSMLICASTSSPQQQAPATNPLFAQLEILNREIAVIAPGASKDPRVAEELIATQVATHLSVIKELVEQDRKYLYLSNVHGQKPIHVAASNLHSEIVEFLITEMKKGKRRINEADILSKKPVDYVVYHSGIAAHLESPYPMILQRPLRSRVLELFIQHDSSLHERHYREALSPFDPLDCCTIS